MTSQADSSSPTSEGTGDFTVLHRDFRSDDVGSGATLARLEKERGAAIARVCRLLTEEATPSRPLRVVLVGKHGSGKSSFINSVAAAFSEDCWREYAYTGFHGGAAESTLSGASAITTFTQKFEKCCNERQERYREIPLPTLIDVAGKMDIGDDKMEELLRLLFYGHIQEDSAIMRAYEFCERHSVDEIRAEYRQAYPDMKVDRVIFVASAADKIPEKLISCVIRAARPAHFKDVRRTIPVFGVLTKKDKVADPDGSEFKDKKETFMRALGLHANRFLFCSNYCDDTDPEGTRTQRLDPRLDVPIVQFFQQVCDFAQKVIQDREELPGTSGRTPRNGADGRKQPRGEGAVTHAQTVCIGLDPFMQALVTSAGVLVLMWLALYVLLVLPSSGGFETSVREACRQGNIKDSVIMDACKTSPPASPLWGTTLISFTAAIGCFLYMVLGRRN